jgi:FSR family fosmidomycin resistance protein-like MFS transporter
MDTATAKPLNVTEPVEGKFQTSQILHITGAHFINDTFTGFIPTTLPVLMEKLSLSLTMVGTLTAIMQLPAILNPVIGFYADRLSLQVFVILAPAVTGTVVSLLGMANSTLALAIMLFITGISVACFHAPAPAMIASLSGRKIGFGMSLFMAGGELAWTVGPILAAWAISIWTLEGMYRLMAIGWLTALVLFLRLRNISARIEKTTGLSAVLPVFRRLFFPLTIANFFRMFILICLTTYLPTLLKMEGASLLVAGGALSILEFAGVAGALMSGTISDILGRKMVMVVSIVSSTLLMYVFLNSSGWITVPILLLLGFTALSSTPVMLAMVQEQVPTHRGMANGIYMAMTFFLQSIVTLIIGTLGDRIGLRQVFEWSVFLSLLSLPAIMLLPGSFVIGNWSIKSS